jgi:ferredoxin
MAGYDERDTIFSRMELVPGSDRYRDYYTAHPEREQPDTLARSAPPIRDGDAIRQRLVDSTFGLLADMRPLARGAPASGRLDVPPDEASAFLKGLALSYGAVLFGTAVLGDACFYGIRGRGAEYGLPVEVPGRSAAVFAVRMEAGEFADAPSQRASAEVVNGYARVALIGLVIARCLRGWGREASCTMDGRADVVLPLAARYAGLGSIGRSGLLLTAEYGPCVRLGAVLSDMPLGALPRGGGTASRACSACTRCAQACPASAIDHGPAANGRFTPVDDDACFSKWRESGTDCGLCIAACPLAR